MNICNMLFEGMFIVKCESKLFEMINQFKSLVVYDGGPEVVVECG